MACLMHGNLSACLFEKIAHVLLTLEIAHALGTYYALGPLSGYEMVEVNQIHGAAAIEYPCTYTIFVSMGMFVIMVVPAATVPVFVVVMVTVAFFMMVMSAMRTCFLIVMMMIVVMALMMLCLFMFRVVQLLYPSC